VSLSETQTRTYRWCSPPKIGDERTRPAATLPRTYIASVKRNYPVKAVFDPFAARACREGWSYYELATGHDSQAEMPDALSELLLNVPA
jgi:hypothetical protein